MNVFLVALLVLAAILTACFFLINTALLLTILFIFVCVLVIAIVLAQPSQGEGLGSAFGGGISESFFGTRAMTWYARATIVLILVFFGLAILLNRIPQAASDRSRSVTDPEAHPAPKEGTPAEGSAPSGIPRGSAPATPRVPAQPTAPPGAPPPSPAPSSP